jgi:hypothetical protein
MRLRQAKRYVIGYICPRIGAAGGLEYCQMLLRIKKNVNRNVALQRKGTEIAQF